MSTLTFLTLDRKGRTTLPEVRSRITRAEEDFAQGRSTRTETPEQAQAFLDGLKKKPASRS